MCFSITKNRCFSKVWTAKELKSAKPFWNILNDIKNISKIYQNMVLSQATVHLSFGQKIRLLCQHQAIALEPKPSPESPDCFYMFLPLAFLRCCGCFSGRLSDLNANFRNPKFQLKTHFCCLKESPSYLSSDPTLQLSCCSIPLAGVSGAKWSKSMNLSLPASILIPPKDFSSLSLLASFVLK